VRIATLDALAERFGSELPERPASLWRGMLEGERRQADGGADDAVAAKMAEAGEAIAAGADRLDEWPLEGHGWSLLEGGLSRAYRDARREMRRVGASGSAEDVHEWRKRAKDLWYDLRLLRGAWKPVLGELAEQAHELADLLGDHHDLTVLAEDLDRRQAVRERERIAELIELRQAELLGEALKLGRRLFAEKPKAFRRRLEAYWRAWR
jgi:CHAD domain-containing protein